MVRSPPAVICLSQGSISSARLSTVKLPVYFVKKLS
jgi:hypothetical protein